MKGLEICFSTLQQLISLIRLQRVMKKEWFLCFLRSLLINYLITLSLEKEIIVLEKLLEKVLNFGSKKQSVRTLPPGSLCTDPLPSGKIGGGVCTQATP